MRVDPAQFCGTVYTAAGWIEPGQTEGWGRVRPEYYVKHNRPRRLFVCPLERNSTRRLQAEVLIPRLAVVEAAVPPRSLLKAREFRSLMEQFKAVPDLRARLRRHLHLQGHSPEEVCLITSVEPARLDAVPWIQLNRQAWGIESGLHQRLDVSHNDDRCRVRHPNSMLLFAIMRRLANSLFMEWKTQFPNPDHKTTTDFQGHFSANHHRRSIRFLASKHPHLKIPS